MQVRPHPVARIGDGAGAVRARGVAVLRSPPRQLPLLRAARRRRQQRQARPPPPPAPPPTGRRTSSSSWHRPPLIQILTHTHTNVDEHVYLLYTLACRDRCRAAGSRANSWSPWLPLDEQTNLWRIDGEEGRLVTHEQGTFFLGTQYPTDGVLSTAHTAAWLRAGICSFD